MTKTLAIYSAVIIGLNANAEDAKKPKLSGLLSPDGTQILYHKRSDNGVYTGYIANSDGTNEKKLIEQVSSRHSCAWYPDSKKVLWASRKTGKFQIYSMTPNGENLNQLTKNPLGSSQPTVSSQGQAAYLSFQKRMGMLMESHLIVLGDDGPKQILKDARVNSFKWSPDGKSIAAAGSGEVWICRLDGAAPVVKNIKMSDRDKRLSHHTASCHSWSTDSQEALFHFWWQGQTMAGSTTPIPAPGSHKFSVDGKSVPLSKEEKLQPKSRF